MKVDISVILPSRGRPEKLLRCVQSLTQELNPGVEIIVGLDADDQTMEQSAELISRLPSVRIMQAPRARTLGALNNALAAGANGAWLFHFVDDVVVKERDWPERLLNVAKTLPRGYGVLYPKDDLHPNFPSMPIISRKTRDVVGWNMNPIFPYWFADTTWNEIGHIMGAISQCGFTVESPEGKAKTHGLIDFSFWRDVFDATRPVRVKAAIELAKRAYDDQGERAKKMMVELPQRIDACKQAVAHLQNPYLVKAVEEMGDAPPSEAYSQVKEEATKLLGDLRQATPRPIRVGIAVPSGDTWRAETSSFIACASAVAATRGIDLFWCNVRSSVISYARNTTVEACRQQNCDYIWWVDSDMAGPFDTLLRLLAHDKDIVGCFYNKRVAPFETLGKLRGPQPEKIDGGLHEALLMPGGMVLVKMSVYTTIKWPAYFETYRWPGKDGYESMKTMLRNIFVLPPPDSAIESLDNTEFAEWVKTHYNIAEHSPQIAYDSEDHNFCRKARRHGFKIWCDLDLTYEMKHIGSLEVTCSRPQEGQVKQVTPPMPKLTINMDVEVAQ